MTEVAQLIIPVHLDLNKFRRDLQELESIANKEAPKVGQKAGQGFASSFSSGVKPLQSIVVGVFQGIGQQITSIMAGAISSAVSSVQSLAAEIYKVGTASENASMTFKTLLGDAEKANKVLNEIKTFAASTPFELPEVTEAGKKLVALGVEAENLIPTLTNVGNIAAGLGIPFNELAEIYGKIKVQNRVFAEDINQLQGRGIPIVAELAKMYGKTNEEIRKLIEDGRIGFTQVEAAFGRLTGEGGKFNGLMADLATTTGGKMTNLADTITQSFTAIFDAVKPAINAVLDATAEGFKAVGIDLTSLNVLAQDFANYLKANPQLIADIATAIETFLQNALNTSVAFLREMVAWWDKNKDAIIATGTALQNSVVAKFQALVGLSKSIDEYFQRYPIVLTAIKGIVDSIGLGYQVWGTLLKGAAETFGYILQTVTNILDKLGIAVNRTRELSELNKLQQQHQDQSSTSTAEAPAADVVSRVVNAIIQKESNGNSKAVNKDSGALGLGQVMPANVRPWTKKYYSRELSPQEFLASEGAQIVTIRGAVTEMFEKALKAAGGDVQIAIRRVAAEWYSGQPQLHNNTRGQGGYPSIKAYADAISKAVPVTPGTALIPNNTVTGLRTGGAPGYFLQGQTLGSSNITSGFGMRQHPVTGGNKMHNGIDVAVPVGTHIISPVDGTAKRAFDPGGYGLWLLIQSGNTEYGFGHLSEILVADGAQVKKGQIVAKSGGAKGNPNSGTSTGAHIDAHVRQGGQFVDPKTVYGGSAPGAKITTTSSGARASGSGTTPPPLLADPNAEKDAERAADKARRDAEAAQKKARQDLIDADRARQEGIEQGRKDRDARIKADQENERQRRQNEIDKATGATRTNLEQSMKRWQTNNEGQAQLRQLMDTDADLRAAQSLKIRTGEKGGIDYAAAIKANQQLIKLAQDNLKLQTQGIDAETQRLTLAENRQRIESVSAQNAQQRDELREQQGIVAALQDQLNVDKTITPQQAERLRLAQELADIEENINAKMQANTEEIAKNLDLQAQKKAGTLDDDTDYESRINHLKNINSSLAEELTTRQAIAAEQQRSLDLEEEQARVMQNWDYAKRWDRLREITQTSVDNSRAAVEQVMSDMDDLTQKNNEAMDEAWKKANELNFAIVDTIGGSVKNLFSDLITGTKSLGETLLSFIGNLASQLSSLALNSIFGSASGGAGLLGGIFGSIFGSSPASNVLPPMSLLNSVLKVPGFATGAKVNDPTLAVIAEKRPEYVIPQADMEKMKGGGDIIIHNTINNSGAGNMSAQQAEQMNRQITHAVESTLLRHHRPGGLFS
ncbi:tape measure protein [Chroococcidiopsis sp. CCMEE 29]|uniref:tape measure protein n=1 Tax=Chroococcidiopsis sp. CCMEE 29 TaxID=155894 RepID=UPI00202132F2|nr:tape measure protein [Chroococcidiopsis sp. CCMEE 29]